MIELLKNILKVFLPLFAIIIFGVAPLYGIIMFGVTHPDTILTAVEIVLMIVGYVSIIIGILITVLTE